MEIFDEIDDLIQDAATASIQRGRFNSIQVRLIEDLRPVRDAQRLKDEQLHGAANLNYVPPPRNMAGHQQKEDDDKDLFY